MNWCMIIHDSFSSIVWLSFSSMSVWYCFPVWLFFSKGLKLHALSLKRMLWYYTSWILTKQFIPFTNVIKASPQTTHTPPVIFSNFAYLFTTSWKSSSAVVTCYINLNFMLPLTPLHPYAVANVWSLYWHHFFNSLFEAIEAPGCISCYWH